MVDSPENKSHEPKITPGPITKIEAQKRHADRVSIFVKDEFALGVHKEVLRAFDLRVGQHLDRATWTRLARADEVVVARQRALDYLARRARSELEMRRYLQRKEFAPNVIEAVIDELTDEDHLDDRAYALAFAEQRFRLHGHGPRRIESDLFQRGVAREWIEEAVAEVRTEEDMRSAALDHADQRWAYLASKEPDPRKRRKKMYDYLRRRGFSYEIIRDVVEEVETRQEKSS